MLFRSLGGRVGGVRPPYRDQQVIKNILVTKISLLTGGLDMPSAVASGYSTTEGCFVVRENVKVVPSPDSL